MDCPTGRCHQKGGRCSSKTRQAEKRGGAGRGKKGSKLRDRHAVLASSLVMMQPICRNRFPAALPSGWSPSSIWSPCHSPVSQSCHGATSLVPPPPLCCHSQSVHTHTHAPPPIVSVRISRHVCLLRVRVITLTHPGGIHNRTPHST